MLPAVSQTNINKMIFTATFSWLRDIKCINCFFWVLLAKQWEVSRPSQFTQFSPRISTIIKKFSLHCSLVPFLRNSQDDKKKNHIHFMGVQNYLMPFMCKFAVQGCQFRISKLYHTLKTMLLRGKCFLCCLSSKAWTLPPPSLIWRLCFGKDSFQVKRGLLNKVEYIW